MMASSLSTVLGGLGFAAYAAANHVLDALAERQHQLGRTWWTSVAWDGWRAPDAPGAVAGPAAHAMTAEEGGEAFARLLSLPRRARLAVSTADLGARRRAWTQPAAAAPAAGPEASLAQHARPDLHTVYAPPETTTERRLAQVWGALLGIDRVGLDDNFFELGGSSLLAVQLVGKLRPEFAGELSVTTLFEAPTVRALSRVIDAPAERGRDLDRSQGRGRMRREIRTDRRMVDATVE
jgi:acyl carrier protein